MLESSLGIDTSTLEGWRDLAIVALPVCLIFGFFSDFILERIGFGVLGNGFIAVGGMILAMKAIDRFVAPSYAINVTGAAIFVAASGGLFLAALATLRRRFC